VKIIEHHNITQIKLDKNHLLTGAAMQLLHIHLRPKTATAILLRETLKMTNITNMPMTP